MNSLALLILISLHGQPAGCEQESFPERLLAPINEIQKSSGLIAIDRFGEVVALSHLFAGRGGARVQLVDCRNSPLGLDFGIDDPPAGFVVKRRDGSFFIANAVRGRFFNREGEPVGEGVDLYPDSSIPAADEVYRGGLFGLKLDRDENIIVGWTFRLYFDLDISPLPPPVIMMVVRKLDPSGKWLGQEVVIRTDDYPDLQQGDGGRATALEANENGQIVLLAVLENEWPDFGWWTYVVWLLDSDLRLTRAPVTVTKRTAQFPPGSYSGANVDAEGRFVVAWRYPGEDYWSTITWDRILAQRFSPTGEPIGTEIAVSGPPLQSDHFRHPKVAMYADGRFVVVWDWVRRGLIVGQRFSPDGEKVGRQFQVNVLRPGERSIVVSDRQDLLAFDYWLGTDPGNQTVATRILSWNAQEFIRGDANESGEVDISDAIAILEYLFLGGEVRPVVSAADANDDGRVEITDALHVLFHLFVGGREFRIPHPYPIWGFDPTPNEG